MWWGGLVRVGERGAVCMCVYLGDGWAGAWRGFPIGSLCCSDNNILNIPMFKFVNLK